MIFGIAAGLAGDDDVIARLDTVACHALASELSTGSPFDRPRLHHTFFVGRVHMQKRVRVTNRN